MLRSKRASVWHASPFERMGVWICIAFHPFFVWAGPQCGKKIRANFGRAHPRCRYDLKRTNEHSQTFMASDPSEIVSTIANFAGIAAPAPLKAKVDTVIQLDTSGLDNFHTQLLQSLSKSEAVRKPLELLCDSVTAV